MLAASFPATRRVPLPFLLARCPVHAKMDSVGPIYHETSVQSHLKFNYEDFHPESKGGWRGKPCVRSEFFSFYSLPPQTLA